MTSGVQHADALHRAFAQSLLLDRDQLNRGLSNLGSLFRLDRGLLKLLRGEAAEAPLHEPD